jgi:hypothetical protein
MKKLRFLLLSMAASLFLGSGLLAQEQVELSVKLSKDGKVVRDTTYQFKDASQAKHALKMMEMMSADDAGKQETKHVVVMRSDGESTFDILVDEDFDDGDLVKKKKVNVVVSGDEEGSWTVVERDDIDLDNEEDVYVIKGDDDVKTEIIKILKDYDGEEDSDVKVIVLQKKEKKEKR